ncbi:hypothetical protein SNEBB_008083 [Seison nebaliae]|nr:hypothetical protein SNEBB_008083 [Seison nebaliae]
MIFSICFSLGFTLSVLPLPSLGTRLLCFGKGDGNDDNNFLKPLPGNFTSKYPKGRRKSSGNTVEIAAPAVNRAMCAEVYGNQFMALLRKLPPSVTETMILKTVNSFFNTPNTIMYPREIKKNRMCDIPESYQTNGYYTIRVLGKGVQGTVHLLHNRLGNKLAFKGFDNLADFLVQINAALALTEFDSPYKVVGMMKGYGKKMPENSLQIHAENRMGPFCLILSYVEGRTMLDMIRKNEFPPAEDSEEIQKRYIGMIVNILRELQMLHFTFNRYAMYENIKVFGANSFTNGHGDLQIGNILVSKQGNLEIPHLIDAGYSFTFLLHDPNEILTQVFNNYLLDGTLPIKTRQQHVVHRNQLLNSAQNYDFCTLMGLIYMTFLAEEFKHTFPAKLCLDIFKWSRDHGNPVRNLEFVDWVKDNSELFKPIIFLLAGFARPFLTYADTWLKITAILGAELNPKY